MSQSHDRSKVHFETIDAHMDSLQASTGVAENVTTTRRKSATKKWKLKLKMLIGKLDAGTLLHLSVCMLQSVTLVCSVVLSKMSFVCELSFNEMSIQGFLEFIVVSR